MRKQRAVAYIRVSGKRQVKGGSLKTQSGLVKAYAMQHGYLLMKIFAEPGESAKTDQHPVLKELVAYCRKNRANLEVVIFYKIDRFARYTRDYSNLRHDLKKLGIRLESTSETFDDTPAGRFMENVLASTARYDNEVRAERAQFGLRQAIQDGRWVWVAPPGYRRTKYNGKWTIEPDPTTGPLMIQAFQRLVASHRPSEVRLWLWRHEIKLSRTAFYR